MDSKTLTSGIASILSQSPALATWKLKGSKLVLKQGPIELTLVPKKLSPRVLEPWQRVGMFVRLVLELRHSGLAGMMNLPARTVLVRTEIQHRSGNPWNTTLDSPESLGQEIAARLDGILPELQRVLLHPAGLESVFRFRIEQRSNPGKVTVALPKGLAKVGAKSVFVSATIQPTTAYYVASLLLRNAVKEAEGFIGEGERSSLTSFVETKSFPIWPALLLHIDGLKARGAEIIASTPADWDFAALDAGLDKAALDAKAPEIPSPEPAAEPMEVPPLFDRVTALLALPAAWTLEGGGLPIPERQRWYAALSLLKNHSLSAEQTALLDELLDGLQDRLRSGSSSEEAFPAAWRALRAMNLPNKAESVAAAITTATASRGLGALNPSTLPPTLHTVEGKMSSHLELMELVDGLPELTTLHLQATDAPLAAAVKEGCLARIQSLTASDYKGFDKSVKALGKAAPALRHLDLSKVAAAAAKSLGKSKVAPNLETLALETSEKGWADLLPLWERFTQLTCLTLRMGTLRDMVLPKGLKELTLRNPSAKGFDFDAQDLALERFRLDGSVISFMRLAVDSAPSLKILHLHVSWEAITADLAKLAWPKMGELHLHLHRPEKKDLPALISWLKTMPKLHTLDLSLGLSAEEERELFAAVPGLQVLSIRSTTIFHSLKVQSWPSLRMLSLSLSNRDRIQVPFTDRDAQFFLDHMPALVYVARSGGISELSEDLTAALTERLARASF